MSFFRHFLCYIPHFCRKFASVNLRMKDLHSPEASATETERYTKTKQNRHQQEGEALLSPETLNGKKAKNYDQRKSRRYRR